MNFTSLIGSSGGISLEIVNMSSGEMNLGSLLFDDTPSIADSHTQLP